MDPDAATGLGGFIVGFFTFFLFMLFVTSFWPQYSGLYIDGAKSIQKEAFEKGFMRKEVDKDDKVIYKWIELEKQ